LEKKPLNDIETQHMHYPESLKKVSDLATQLHLNKTDDRLFFHNLSHAVRLLESTHQMSAHYKLDEKNHFIVCSAAWLYDLEMIASGTLIAASHNLCAAHGPSEIKRILRSYDHTLGIIREAIDKGDIAERLAGATVAPMVRA
jgi:hypothetical protein